MENSDRRDEDVGFGTTVACLREREGTNTCLTAEIRN
jgi:hypothetical protein